MDEVESETDQDEEADDRDTDGGDSDEATAVERLVDGVGNLGDIIADAAVGEVAHSETVPSSDSEVEAAVHIC